MHNTAYNLEPDQLIFSKVVKSSRKGMRTRELTRILYVVDKENRKMITGADAIIRTAIHDVGKHLSDKQPDIILVSADLASEFGRYLGELKTYGKTHCVPVILYSPGFCKLNQNIAIKFDFDEYYFGDFRNFTLKKIKFYKKLKAYRINASKPARTKRWCTRNINFLKRTIDIALSLIILLALSPLFLIIALAIKLESRGPVFYISKRAGFGYRIFNFYKFRSMHADADKWLEQLKEFNQYGDSAFFKMKDDPRITRVGNFLRNTSLDELPQLINVLKGDMSLVGNRPLPLYEAEHLTKDKTAGRFLAPAGITGLWQITKRGKKDVSEGERIKLDITYAKKWSVWYDIKILFMTVPALLQKEPV